MEGKGEGEMGACYFVRRPAKLITVSGQLARWQEFSFNILA